MAAISTTFYHPLWTSYNNSNHHRTKRQAPSRQGVRSMTVTSCRKQKLPDGEDQEVIQRIVRRIVSEAEKFGKDLKPEKKKKGDVKDLMLMSLSFAVYVYISQLLVCAYFSWQHLSFPNPSW
ncbi:hypothetical protein CARUB_v10018246mg [Capsella rubella]|uniref:Uncharacterized protein n=1 Tax=Capsella rubella TaxID=81985 RepID=R0FRV0_9BRAS|nr:uncharacterized protein LOC17887466 [Capsella rubella]EOA24951.1 hypothetical protein CARUB_v10018246mg [Capsella rubella]